MPEARFVLKEPTATTPTLIYLMYRFNSRRLKYSIGYKVHPNNWNEAEQRAKQIKSIPYTQINGRIKTLAGLVDKEYLQLINNNIVPTPEKLKIPLDDFLNKNSKEESLSFLKFIEEFINTSQKKVNTKKQYKTTLMWLIKYKSFIKKDIDFSDIDLNFYNDFILFLKSNNYGLNSIGTLIKNIKVFMNEAVERELTSNLQFKNKRFKIMEEESENIYLTQQEIKSLYELDLSNNKRLEKVRDLFIIGCYTGLRFSDLVQMREENLIDNKTKVRIKTEKTGETIVVPLHTYIKEILEKNGGIIPEVISNQKMNQYLKELGKLGNINEDVLITSTKGGVKKTEVFKKYELITVHTARRSFATNAYLNDIPSISIMKITGHRTENSFLKYIKISQEDNANKLSNHPFFN